MAVKIPPNTKLKHLPLETRVALRLVTLAENKKNVAEMRPMAKELGVEFKQVMDAVISLSKLGFVNVKPLTAASFEFLIDEKHRASLQLAASNYSRHLKTRAEKGLKPRPRSAPPAHLKPVTEEQRAPWMEKGLVIATKIGAPKLAFKVANCIVRIGEAEVEALFQRTSELQKAGTQPALSAVATFFTLYLDRRRVLVPAPAPVAVV